MKWSNERDMQCTFGSSVQHIYSNTILNLTFSCPMEWPYGKLKHDGYLNIQRRDRSCQFIRKWKSRRIFFLCMKPTFIIKNSMALCWKHNCVWYIQNTIKTMFSLGQLLISSLKDNFKKKIWKQHRNHIKR